LLKTDVIKYTSVKSRPFGAGTRAAPVVMNNHDHLLGRVAGLDGLKTGFTNGAGFCLSATAERNGHRIIVVVMGSSDSKTRDVKVMELLERGFTLIPPGGPAFTRAAPAAGVAVQPVDNSPISAAPMAAAEKSAMSPADAQPVIKFSLPTAKKK
jgi:D-alanyl-D-alanine carboxypeptidase (penicillin-binding protein 5/6)